MRLIICARSLLWSPCSAVGLLSRTRHGRLVALQLPAACSYSASNRCHFSSCVTTKSWPLIVRSIFTTCAAQSSASPGHTVQFNLSDIGEGIAEVLIKEWYVSVGDSVKQFDNICEVQSDKAAVTITSRYEGVISKLYYDVDDTAKVGKPLVDIEMTEDETNEQQLEDKDEDLSSSSSDSEGEDSEISTGAALVSTGATGKVLATPAVRRLAMENKVLLSKVKGSGKSGRILKEDIMEYIRIGQPDDVVQPADVVQTAQAMQTAQAVQTAQAMQTAQAVQTAQTLEAAQLVHASHAVQTAPHRTTAPSPGSKDRTESIKGFKKVMVKSMTAALRIPHFGYCDEINISRLIAIRSDLKAVASARGIKLTYMPFFIKAASMALLHYPVLNAHVDDACENIIYKGSHNIGVAMDTSAGLIVPNIKGCEGLTLYEISAELNRLSELGVKGQLQQYDLVDGTFSLSNIGSIGGTYASPVIMSPQVAIGAIGKIQAVGRYIDGSDVMSKCQVVNVSWSADHRVIDGATMCRYSNKFKEYLENPSYMMVDMR